MRRIAIASCVALLPAVAAAAEFTYNDPGVLVPGSGTGAADATVYAPGMRFPIEEGPAYPNSQVWGHGGSEGPGGSQCDVENYSYPWWDNYCETRSWDMPLCPAGVGHQGQDIRPATCDNLVHWNVASEAGEITNIGSYSVYVTAPDGTRFDYLHGGNVIVGLGQQVAKGERIDQVSNEFGGTPTTYHLHFNIRQDVAGYGSVYVSPYMSLVESYEELLGIVTPGDGVQGSASASTCAAIEGWAQDPADPEASIAVELWFGGPSDDPAAVGIEVIADRHREDLCEQLGSCEHGFEVEIPRSLQDDAPHPVHVYGVTAGGAVEIESSPASIGCPPPAIPAGVRRAAPPEIIAAWGLSPFWDAATLGASELEGIDEGEPFPDEPVLVRSDDPDDAGKVWLMDPGYRRPVSDEAATVWGLDLGQVALWPGEVLHDVPEGTPLRTEIFLVQADGLGVHVIDDAQCPPGQTCDPPDGGSEGGQGEGGEGNGSAGEGGISDTDGSALPGGNRDDDSGCGCRSEPAPPMLAWLLLAGLAAIRRRR
jgi:MYXO-CTERM domain-containing protein